MQRFVIAGLLAIGFAAPASAELPVGQIAPGFTAEAAKAGKRFEFSLSAELKKGPVVLYFFPEALTGECLIENYEFSDVVPRVKAAGATLIGMSKDSIETLELSSVLECSNRLPLAADPQLGVIRAFGAESAQKPGQAGSVSFVIAPDQRIIYTRTNPDSDPVNHARETVDALEKWRAEQASASVVPESFTGDPGR